ncbi:tRNA epoxyqueuosine(34) reductase QueG [bacterium]|nr:tRNA epoxyqueuosine(34) reductase QueG [bacterium]
MKTFDSNVVTECCLSQDFALVGITGARPTRFNHELDSWLKEGKQGEMDWMNRNVNIRKDPRQLLEGANSVVCVADRYSILKEGPLKHVEGRIARYARGKDYHKIMKERLHEVCDKLKEIAPKESFRACVDTAPVLEREFASSAGLGSIGKHTLLIEQGVGSWLLLGVIVTTAKLTPTELVEQDPCATCTRCIDACPTDAITPWSVDARKCVSYLTIEHRTEIDPKFFSGIGEWMFGCDICQEVCPHNQPNEKGAEKSVHDAYSPTLSSLNVLDVLLWNEEARRNAFRSSSMKRAKLGMMRRNAVIVAGNLLKRKYDTELLTALKTIAAGDEDEMVRNTAIAVLENQANS